MKNYNYEKWVIVLLALMLVVVYFDKRQTIKEMEEKISQQEEKIKELTENLEEMELERQNLIDAIDLRESEVSFWGRLSDLYREGKRKEAEEMRGDMQKYNEYEPKY